MVVEEWLYFKQKNLSAFPLCNSVLHNHSYNFWYQFYFIRTGKNAGAGRERKTVSIRTFYFTFSFCSSRRDCFSDAF